MKTPPSLLLSPRVLARSFAAFAAVLILSHTTQAASIYWDGTGTSWNTVGSWSNAIGSTSDPGAVPVSGDTAIFNTNGTNALQTVNLDANQSVGGAGGLSFNLNATGGVTLLGGDADHTLALGTAGIGINAAAGPVTIGSTTAGQGVSLILGGNQNWTNNGSSLLTINNGITNTAGSVISLVGTGSGGVTVNGIIANGTSTTGLTVNNASGTGINTLTGANTYTGVTTITKGTLVLSGANGALANTITTIGNGGVLTLDDRGVASANANRMGTAAITISNGGAFKYLGSDQAATNSTETIGTITLGSGISTITVTYGGANAATVTSSAATGGFTRTASTGGISLINGTNLGANTVAVGSVGQFLSATGPTTVGTTAGGTTGINAAAKDTRIAIFRLGESGSASGQNGTATGTANTFLTYNATTGYRPLNPADEFTNNAIIATNNTYLTTGTTNTAGTTAINSLVANGGNLYITGGDTLTNTSGMLLFAQSGSISGAGTFTLGGASNQEGVIALNAGVNATISSTLATGTTGLTLYGAGTLTLSGSNSYAGTTAVGTGVTLVIASNSALGTSSVTALGGTIKGDGQAHNIAGALINTTSGLTIAGGSDLTFTGSGGGLAFTNATFANTQVKVNNTGTTTFSGVFSLNNAATGSNNGSSILTFGSSANVVITGPIQDNNAGNVAAPSTGFGTLPFTGVGANLTISGNNGYGNLKTTGIVADAAYNTVTVGGPGGSGATITPFGASTINLNTNNPLFLVAETNGQILGNSINSGGSGMGLGFAGTNSMTFGGTWTAGTSSSLTNLATGTFTFGNTISGNSLSLLGSGNTTLNSSATLATGAFALTATQTGTVTLSNTNNWTGLTTFSGGTVVLDYGVTSAGSGTNRLTQNTAAGNAAALTLTGVNLQLSGGTFAQTLGTPSSSVNGTTLGVGQSKISQTNSGTATIALGAITRNAGSAINFQTGVASTTTGNASGILGGYATVGGTDWATGAGTIAALGSYDSFSTPGTDKNILQADSATIAATTTVNSLKITTSAISQALTIGAGQTLNLDSGGLLFTGSNDYAVSGGTLKKTGNGEVIIQQHGTGVLTIDSVIGPTNNSNILTKTGDGTLALTANNTSTVNSTTYILGGTLKISANNNLVGTAVSAISMNGGTLQTTAGFTTARTITLGTNGGTFQVDSGTLALNSTAIISGTSYKGITKTGAGTLDLQAANTFLGPVTVSDGTLKLSNAAALGASSTASNRSVAPVVVNGASAILDINGQTTALGNLTLQNGTISDTAGTGTLAAYSFNLQSGTVGAKLVDLIFTGNTNSNSINVYKTTGGSVTVTGANTYSGSTIISAGALLVNNTTGSGTGTGQVTVNGGTLGGTGTIAPSGSSGITVNSGAFVAPGASIGTLVIDGGSTAAPLLAMNAGSEFNFELGTGVSSDKLNIWNYVDGDFAINGNAVNFVLDASVTSGSHTFNLFNFYTDGGSTLSAATLSGLTLGTLSSNIGSAAFDYTTTGEINLNITAVPEPATWALLAFSLTTVLVLRRRRTT